LDRDYDIPKDILVKNGISQDAFVETDGFYRKGFNLKEDDKENSILFEHGLCMVHAKRNLCVLLNYAIKTDGSPIEEFIKCKWEQDIEDARRLCGKISNAIHICNDITQRCNKDSAFDLVTLKNKELRPVIEDIFEDARAIYEDIRNKPDKEGKIRKCSEKLRKAIVYLVNNEDALKTFLNSPYGLMSSTKVEEKFRALDLLRNGRIASDTCRGAENLALFYSLYKTAQMHGIEFESYMKKVITVMTEQMSKIEFKKDKRGTITDYKSHSIPSEILEELMPWNLTN